LQAGTIIVATGSGPTRPDIEGLAETHPWTNREATSTRKLPRSLVVLGGGPVGVEMSSVFALFGVKVTLVHSHDRLIDKDHPRNSAAAARVLGEDGVELRLNAKAVRVQPGAGAGGAHVVDLSDGSHVEAEQILHALGRSLNLEGLGLESLGLDAAKLPRDGRLRIAENVYLVGDPAGPEAFTHVSHYEGETAVAMALGDDVQPDYRAIPRAIFIEPELASVGVSIEAARAAGTDAFELVADFAQTARGYGVEAEFGHVAIVVDRATGTLIGASIVAPDASAAIHEAVLAIQARIPIEVLTSVIHGFPTTPRAYGGLFADALVELRRRSPVPA
jgi:dihydrolipoamide dehydrogenase